MLSNPDALIQRAIDSNGISDVLDYLTNAQDAGEEPGDVRAGLGKLAQGMSQ